MLVLAGPLPPGSPRHMNPHTQRTSPHLPSYGSPPVSATPGPWRGVRHPETRVRSVSRRGEQWGLRSSMSTPRVGKGVTRDACGVSKRTHRPLAPEVGGGFPHLNSLLALGTPGGRDTRRAHPGEGMGIQGKRHRRKGLSRRKKGNPWEGGPWGSKGTPQRKTRHPRKGPGSSRGVSSGDPGTTPNPHLHRSPRPGNSVTAASAVAPSVSPGARDKSGSQLALSVAIFLL